MPMKVFIKIILGTATVFFLMLNVAHAQNKKNIKKPQPDFIKITDAKGMNEDFVILSKAKFEIQNGNLNIAVLSQANTLFEINGIHENAIKDTILKDGAFRLAFIHSQNEKTYTSNENNSNSILTLKCRGVKKGNPIKIIFSGKVFSGDKFYSIEAQFTGEIPAKKLTSTQRTN